MDFVAFSFEDMSENVVEHSRFFCGTGFDRCPACDSFETGFVDGTVLPFLELREDLFEWDPFAGLFLSLDCWWSIRISFNHEDVGISARRGEDRIVFNHEDSGKFPPKREKGEFR